MSEDKDIIKLSKIIEDKDKLEKVGSEIIKAALKNIAEEKLEIKPQRPESTITIKKGEIVPEALKGIIKTDIEGRAMSGWDKSWLNIGIWNREWSENKKPDEGDILRPSMVKDINKNIFNAEEIRVLKNLNILDDINISK